MDIKGPIEFSNFIKTSSLNNDVMFTKIVECVSNLSGCACTSRDEKIKKYQRCNKLYVDFIKSNANKHKNDLLNKTSDRQIIFHTDTGEIIIIISR